MRLFCFKIIIMKKILWLIPVLIFAFTVNARPPEGHANKGMTFSIATIEKDALDVNELSALLNSNEPKEIKVKGKVVDICKAEGCWLKMETANGPMMIKMKDHSFLVPLSMNGKTIVVDGP